MVWIRAISGSRENSKPDSSFGIATVAVTTSSYRSNTQDHGNQQL